MKNFTCILLIIMDMILFHFNFKCEDKLQRMIFQFESFLIFLVLMILNCI